MKMRLKDIITSIRDKRKAIQLYRKLGFEVEGILKNDKRLSDEKYYNTVVMGRCI